MPITQIDPQTALIVVDLQKGIVTAPVVHSIDDVIANNQALLSAFRQRGLPVVLVNVTGGAPGRTEQPRPQRTLAADWAELIPELDQQPSDLIVTKKTWGAFTHTGLEDLLREKGVSQVVITGVATGTGVEATARQAYEAGFHVTLAVDAMTDVRPAAHDYSLNAVFPRLGETGTTAEILDLLQKAKA